MEVTIQKAAAILGISPSKIRHRINEGTLKGHQRPAPGGLTWYVELPEEGAGEMPVTALARTEDYQEPSGSQDITSRELVDSLKRQVRTLNEQLTTKDRQIEQLHVLLQLITQSRPKR